LTIETIAHHCVWYVVCFTSLCGMWCVVCGVVCGMWYVVCFTSLCVVCGVLVVFVLQANKIDEALSQFFGKANSFSPEGYYCQLFTVCCPVMH